MKKLKYLLFIPALILAFIFPINTLYAQSNYDYEIQHTLITKSFESFSNKKQVNVINEFNNQLQSISTYLSSSFINNLKSNDLFKGKATLNFDTKDINNVLTIQAESISDSNITLEYTLLNVHYIEYFYQWEFSDTSTLTFYGDSPVHGNLLYTLEDVYLRNIDYFEIDYSGMTNDEINNIKNQSFNNGKNEGIDQGYNEAKGDYGIYYEDEWLTAEQYAVIKVNEKVNELDNLELSIIDFVPGVLGAIFSFFFTLSSMSILGISILDILILVFGVGAVIFVIKLFIK